MKEALFFLLDFSVCMYYACSLAPGQQQSRAPPPLPLRFTPSTFLAAKVQHYSAGSSTFDMCFSHQAISAWYLFLLGSHSVTTTRIVAQEKTLLHHAELEEPTRSIHT